jgi:hypothetical protein
MMGMDAQDLTPMAAAQACHLAHFGLLWIY